VDQFAAKTGLPDPQPFVVNTAGGLALNPTGTNFAVASAQTGHNPNFALPNLLTSREVPWTTDQVGIFNYVNKSMASPSSLYTFWAGSDDIAHALTTNPLNFVDAAKDAANTIEANIKMLAGEGGRYFMWFNLPPLGETPAARAFGAVGTLLANQAASAFNDQMNADITGLQQTLSGVTIIGVDIHSEFERITDNPKAYGFTNVTDPAQGNSGVNPNTYLFWDDLHPTTAADKLIADAAFAAAGRLVAPVPEPASVLLALLGIAALIGPLLIRARRTEAALEQAVKL
jgi:phospholipase/lecithinase/hemolysin